MAGCGNSVPAAMVGRVIPLVRHSLGEGGNSPNREGRNEMRRDKLFGNKFMRFAACTLMAFACAGEAWGDGLAAGPNPSYLRWKKMQSLKSRKEPSKVKARLLSAASQEEGENYSLGYIPSPIDKSYLRNLNVSSPMMAHTMGASAVSLDSRYDLREKGRTTPVRNQGSYGTCWAHGTMASIESWLLTSGKEGYDFSEKHLAQKIDYTGYSHALNKYGISGISGYYNGYVKSGIDGGGSGDRATSYLAQWKGPVLETNDPYPDGSYLNLWKKALLTNSSVCLNDFLPPSPDITPVGHVQKVRWIPLMHYTDDSRTVIDELVAIKQALINYGALSTSYYHDLSYYKTYNGKSRATYCYRGDEQSPNHIVAIIGWDDNFKKGNFASIPPGDGAFIAKNSWGTSFGDEGYFYVSYYDRYFAKEELMSFSNIEPVDNYASIYQYDPQGLVERWSPVNGGAETAWGANMFIARDSEDLAAVGFYAFVPGTKYEISVYVNCEDSKPISGSHEMALNGETDCAGFVTIPFKQTVSVIKGRRFSAVIKLNTPGDTKPLALEGFRYANNEEASANPGESFVSTDGKNWKDLTTWRMPFYGSGTYNFCCKVYTKSKTPPKPSLLSIVVKPADDKTMSLKPGDKVQMKCEATYSNNGTSNVTDAAQWSLTSGRSYATLS